MTKDQNKKHDQIMKMLENQGSSSQNKQRNSSSIYITSSCTFASLPPPPPWPPYNLEDAPYQPLITCPPRAKIKISKYNGREDQCVSWLNKAGEYLTIYNIKVDEKKVKYASMHREGNA